MQIKSKNKPLNLVRKGQPSKDSFPARLNGECKETMEDNDCFERCLKNEWGLARPNYNVIPNQWLARSLYTNSINCQDYDTSINRKCASQCHVASIQQREALSNSIKLYNKVMGH